MLPGVTKQEARETEEIPQDSSELEPVATNVVPVLTCPSILPARHGQDIRSHGRLVVVYKSLYQLGLYQDGKLMEDDGKAICYPISMGAKPWGAKVVKDNKSTPEGWYKTASKQDVGSTAFYRGFLINYPNQEDVTRAFETGVIQEPLYKRLNASISAGKTPAQNTIMGGEIMIHGMGTWTPTWTAGCVAMDNAAIDILFHHVRHGDGVLITPWTERYTRNATGELVVSDVPFPKGESAELILPLNPAWVGGTRNTQLVSLKIDLSGENHVTLTIP